MARKKAVTEMSAEELYELARRREREEFEAQREAARAQMEELKEQRRELISRHRKELAAVDREIRSLGGRVRVGRHGGDGKISEQVVALIAEAGSISTKDLKTRLEESGVETKNLNQMLAYLKRNSRVVSPDRGIYSVPR